MKPQAPGADAGLVETRQHGEPILEGTFLRAVRDTVRLPDGQQATREYVLHPGAVMVVALHDDGSVVLERQYRHPLGRVMIEFPAGKLDAGEASLACAQRELLEETGYRAREWAYAGQLHPVIAYSNEFIDIWFARGLSSGAQQLDEGEFVQVFSATLDELLEGCRSGLVTDAKTLSGLLWLEKVACGAWTLEWTQPGRAQDPAG